MFASNAYCQGPAVFFLVPVLALSAQVTMLKVRPSRLPTVSMQVCEGAAMQRGSGGFDPSTVGKKQLPAYDRLPLGQSVVPTWLARAIWMRAQVLPQGGAG